MLFEGGAGIEGDGAGYSETKLVVGPLLQHLYTWKKIRFQIEILDLTARCVVCNWQWCYRWSLLWSLTSVNCMLTAANERFPQVWTTLSKLCFAFLALLNRILHLSYSSAPTYGQYSHFHTFFSYETAKLLSKTSLFPFLSKFDENLHTTCVDTRWNTLAHMDNFHSKTEFRLSHYKYIKITFCKQHLKLQNLDIDDNVLQIMQNNGYLWNKYRKLKVQNNSKYC